MSLGMNHSGIQTYSWSLLLLKGAMRYVWIPEWFIPRDIIEEYNIKTLIQNGSVLSECITCIYGLPQAGLFSYVKLVKHLDDDCYFPTGHTPGLFFHLTRPTTFNLVVDKFGAQIDGKHNADYIINILNNTTTSLLIGMVKTFLELS